MIPDNRFVSRESLIGVLRDQVDRFVVLDVESTGVYNKDRVVEVAVVTVSPDGETVDEWDTLVNPERDVGPTYIHRITASMVSAAPTFEEIAPALAERLDGAVLVTHNLPFDSRMISNEFRRLGIAFDPGVGVCTLRATGQKLEYATRSRGIPLENAHRALSDARAAADLLRSLPPVSAGAGVSAVSVECTTHTYRPRTFRRDMTQEPGSEMPCIARLTSRSQRYSEHGSALAYMELLDLAISDARITDAEQAQLLNLANEMGLAAPVVADIHQRYVDDLIAASLRDGVVDDQELAVLRRVSAELGLDPSYVADGVASHTSSVARFAVTPGTRVCFTGSAVYPDGSELPRRVLELIAQDLELTSVSGVTKKGCDLLVAADPASQSGKTRTARRYGIPVASVSEFIGVTPGGSIGTR